jgi:mono/diheme cytochrome c family protein
MNRKRISLSICFVLLSAFCSWGQDRALIDKFCVTCHNQKTKTAGLSLDAADFTRPSNSADVWEKVIRKVRAEMMPPFSAPRPDKASMDALASYLETSLDKQAAANPNPGLEQSAVVM